MVNFTDFEKEVLRAATIEGDLENGFDYEVSVWNYMNLSPAQARGALSSLVQKGVLKHTRTKEDGQVWNYYWVKKEFLDEVKKAIKELL